MSKSSHYLFLHFIGFIVCFTIIQIICLSLLLDVAVGKTIEWSISSSPFTTFNEKIVEVTHRDREPGANHVQYGSSNMDESTRGQAIDSDYLSLQLDQTTLPLKGHQGVFAKHHIDKGDLVCEYRGPIVKQIDARRAKLDINYTWDMIDVDGEPAYIMGENVCAFINDCVSILDNPKILNVDFLDNWGKNITELNEKQIPGGSWMPDEIECRAGKDENLVAIKTGGKVLVIANRDIQKGEELFFFYGNQYWHARVLSLLEHGHMDICGGCTPWSLGGRRGAAG